MRDRLIELLQNFKFTCYKGETDYKGGDYTDYCYSQIADYFIANGVIVPPCKVGDTVYAVGLVTQQIIPYVINAITYTKEGLYLWSNQLCFSVEHQLNKTVFLSKEDAEEALEAMTEERRR